MNRVSSSSFGGGEGGRGCWLMLRESVDRHAGFAPRLENGQFTPLLSGCGKEKFFAQKNYGQLAIAWLTISLADDTAVPANQQNQRWQTTI